MKRARPGMIVCMRHMGTSGKIAIAGFLAALALLVLTAVTLHETVLLWFAGAAAVTYVACVSELAVRRRHRTLAASGVGSILFIAFGIAFLRQWGLAFTSDPEALSSPVNAAHPDLYFFLAAGAGAATLLLLFAGTVIPGRGSGPGMRRPARRRPQQRGQQQRSPQQRRPQQRRAQAPGRVAARPATNRTATGGRAAGTKPTGSKASGSRQTGSRATGSAAAGGGTAGGSPRLRPAARQPGRPAARR